MTRKTKNSNGHIRSATAPNVNLDIRAARLSIADAGIAIESSETSILALPTELLLLVFSFCANHALLTIARTCTRLNTISLWTFFRRHGIQESANCLLSLGAPVGVLDAVRMTLCVSPILDIRWRFQAGWDTDEDSLKLGKVKRPFIQGHSYPIPLIDMGTGTGIPGMGPLTRTFDEISNLRAIVSRVPEVRSVCLDFGFPVDAPSFGENRLVDRKLWRREVGALLDGVLDKGCEALHIVDGGALENLYSQHKRLGHRWEKMAVKYKHSARNIEAVESTATLPKPVREKPLKLKELQIDSEMLLLPPFYSWTLALLTSCASTLTQLSFKFSSTSCDDSTSVPTSFLALVDFPNLVEFEINSRTMFSMGKKPETRAEFEDVASFLGRHNQTLRRVCLSGVGQPVRKAASSFDSRKPLFPNLEHITAHVAFILWLLEVLIFPSSDTLFPSANTDKNDAWWASPTDPAILGNLKTIVTSEYYHHQPPVWVMFNDTLRAVTRFCRWRNEPGAGTWDEKLSKSLKAIEPVEVEKQLEKTIELTFLCQDSLQVREWFASHLASPSSSHRQASPPGIRQQRSTSIYMSLSRQRARRIFSEPTHISTVIISPNRCLWLPENTIANLPEWLAFIFDDSVQRTDSGLIYPEVQFLRQQKEVVDLLVAKDFVTRVAENSYLNHMVVEGHYFDLAKIRRDGRGRQSRQSN